MVTLKHVLHVRANRWITEERMLYPAGRDVSLHRQREYVNQLVGVRSDHMSTKETVASMLNQILET